MRRPIGIRYFEITANPVYREWQKEILKIIYNDYNLLKLYGKEYPIINFNAERSISRIEEITTCYDLSERRDMYDIDKTICHNFREIVGPHIKNGKEMQFMLNKIKLSPFGTVDWLSAKLGPYEQTVFTSDILEYELYKYYRKTRGTIVTKNREEILEELPLRNEIHSDHSQYDIVTTGVGRNGALSIQIFYSFINRQNNDYVSPFSIIPETYATRQGRVQMIPEGAFSLHNDKPLDYKKTITNYNLERVCYRKILEDLYGHPIINADNTLMIAPRDNVIIDNIANCLDNENGYFALLGVAVDLVTLRATLCFYLRIDDENFPYKDIMVTDEKTQLVTLEELPNFIANKNITNETAATFAFLLSDEAFTYSLKRSEVNRKIEK